MKNKLFAVLLVFCILMIPFSSYATTLTDGTVQDPSTCRHEWEYDSLRDPTCTEPVSTYRFCHLCGTSETVTVAPLGHNYENWTTIQKATCTQEGIKTATCTRCGHTETKYTSKADHEYGPWKVITEPTSSSCGLSERTCQRCGFVRSKEVYPENTLSRGQNNDKDAVKELQQLLNDNGYDCGSVDGIFGGKTENAVKAWQEDHGFDEDGIAWPIVLDTLRGDAAGLLLSVTWAENPGTVQEGDTLYFSWILTSTNEMTLLSPKIVFSSMDSDESMEGSPVFVSNSVEAGENDILNMNESISGTWSLTVDSTLFSYWAEVVGSGSMQFTFSANAEREDTLALVNSNAVTLEAPIYIPNTFSWIPEEEDSLPALAISKSAISLSNSDGITFPGDVITYMIVVTNNGDQVLYDIDVVDPLHGTNEDEVLETINLEPNEQRSFEFDYVVTDMDALAGYVSNTAYASVWDEIKGGRVIINSNEVVVPVTYPSAEEKGYLTINKYINSEPLNGEFYVEGEAIYYRIEVYNPSAVDVQNVDVFDMPVSLTALAPIIHCDTIVAGESVVFELAYSVTPEDVDRGYVNNTAAVYYEDDQSAVSETVKALTGEFEPETVYTPALVINKTETSKPENGEFYCLGEIVEYAIEVINTSDDLIEGILLYDPILNIDLPLQKIDSLEPNASTIVFLNYTVSDYDVANGFIDNYAFAFIEGIPEEFYSNTVQVLTGELPYIPNQLYIYKSVINNEPANGYYYEEGEPVYYRIEITNPTPEIATNVDLFDGLYSPDDPLAHFDAIESNETVSAEFEYFITEEDAENGHRSNIAYTCLAEPPYTYNYSNEVDIPTGYHYKADDLVISKEAVSTPANGEYYTKYEIVTYKITVGNIGAEPIYSITMQDPLYDYDPLYFIDQLDPGMAGVLTFDYVVSEEDCINGIITNQAIAFTDDYEVVSNVVEVPAGMTIVEPSEPMFALELNKSVLSKPENNLFYQYGETIQYCLEATVTVFENISEPIEVEICDAMLGDPLGVFYASEINQTETFYGEYTVKEEDVNLGYIENTATANWIWKDSWTWQPSNPVTVLTGSETVIPETNLYIRKEAVSSPANYMFYVEGEEVEYYITIGNMSSEEATVDAYLYDNHGTGDLLIYYVDRIAPQDYRQFVFDYKITAEDVERGYVENYAWLDLPDPLISNTVVVETGAITDSEPDITIEKSVIGAPSNYSYYVEGEDVIYIIKVTNQDTEPAEIQATLYDNHGNGDIVLGWIETLNALSYYEYEFHYTVTPEDVERGYVENYAWLDLPNRLYSESVFIMTGGETHSEPDVSIEKFEISNPSNGMYYVENESVWYQVVITNHTDSTATLNAYLYDDHGTGAITFDYIDSIAPYGTYSSTYEYIITSDDVANGLVDNYAFIDLTNATIYSNTVTVYAGEPIQPVMDQFTLVKSILSTPANNEYYVPGEFIVFKLSLSYSGDFTYEDISFGDPLYINHVFEDQTLNGSDWGQFPDAVLSSTSGPLECLLYYQVTDEDANTGVVTNFFTASMHSSNDQDGWISLTSDSVEAIAGYPVTTASMDPICTIEKYVDCIPANGSYFVENELISYMLVVQNITDFEAKNVAVYDPRIGANYFYSVIEPHGIRLIPVDYYVTYNDVVDGYVANIANITWETESGTLAADSNEIVVYTGTEPTTSAVIVKTVESTPANGTFYEEGEIVKFGLYVTNDGELAFTDAYVEDYLVDDPLIWTSISLEPYDSTSASLSYYVTKDDVDNGSITNIASLTFDGKTVYSNEVTILTGKTTPPDPDKPKNPDTPEKTKTNGLSMYKEVVNKPANGSYFTEGETIHFKITLKNTSGKPYTDIESYDILLNTAGHYCDYLPSLITEAFMTIDYAVTPMDIINGEIYNIAWATAVDSDGKTQYVQSNEVYIPLTDTPPINPPTKGDNPVIKTGVGTDDCCRRILTEVSNYGRSYALKFCNTHGSIRTVVDMLLSSADTEAQQTQVWTYANQLWDSQIKSMVEGWLSVADEDAKVLIQKDFDAFEASINAFTVSISKLYPELSESELLKLEADLRMTKCIDLCNALHTAPEARQDSLLNEVESVEQSAVGTCSTVLSADQMTVQFCEDHAGTAMAASRLVAIGKETNTLDDTWYSVMRLYLSELDQIYNTLYKMGTAETRPLIVADRTAFGEMLDARQKVLGLLYPQSPATISEMLTATIQTRISELCK